MYFAKYMIPYFTFLINIFLIEKKHVRCARNVRDPPTMSIPGQGVISGKEVSVARTRATVYLGIPFAEPPIGQLRFAPPYTKVTPWSGIRNASDYAPACIQDELKFQEQDRFLLRLIPDIQYSEDCLYLNIFLPAGNKPPEGWPVMLWFHPGNLSTGATNLWDGSTVAIQQKMIVVTAAYRLSIFGYFTTGDNVAPGNYGLLDQVAAMEWVADKISEFGGASDNIVISGHSGGAASVGLHMLSPLSIGKFSKAIAMSARGIFTNTVRPLSKIPTYVTMIADIFQCESKSSKLVECLRKQDAKTLLEQAGELAEYFGPIVDKDFANDSKAFLPNDPKQLILDERFAKVPLLIGYTGMEESLNLIEKNKDWDNGVTYKQFGDLVMTTVNQELSEMTSNDSCIEFLGSTHLTDTVMFYYTPRPLTTDWSVLRDKYVDYSTEKFYGSGAYYLASALSQLNIQTYMYRFDYRIKTETFFRFPHDEQHLSGWITAPHQFDLPFMWGVPYWTHLRKNITWNSADKKMSDTIITLWANFVKFGNPTQSGTHIKWDIFRDNMSGVMLLDRNSNMSDVMSFDYKAFEFWNGYYPKVFEVLLTSCNMTNTARTWTITTSTHMLSTITLSSIVAHALHSTL